MNPEGATTSGSPGPGPGSPRSGELPRAAAPANREGGQPAIPTRAVVIVLVLILAFYRWTAHEGNTTPAGGYYNAQARAFLCGQLHLLEKPAPELLALADPYDPSKNSRWRLHDLLLYEGRYHLYWGPVPALTLHAPFKLVTNTELTEGSAAWLFVSGALIWMVLVLVRLTRAHVPGTPGPMLVVGVICLAMCTGGAFLLRRPAVYEEAIAAGQFFLWGALWCTIPGAAPAVHPGRLALGGLFLGLAIGSKPILVLATVVPAALCWFVIGAGRTYRSRAGFAACLLGPVVLAIGLLLAYNHVRFGSPLEFGVSYQLSSLDYRTHKLYGPDNLLRGLGHHLLQPPRLDAAFPFFHLTTDDRSVPFGSYTVEPMAGLLAVFPWTLAGLCWPWLLVRRGPSAAPLALVLTLSIVAGLLLLVSISWIVPGTTMRYGHDFAPLLVLPSVLAWFSLDAALGERTRLRTLLRWSFGCILAYACAANMAFSISGPGVPFSATSRSSLRESQPRVFEAMVQAFAPVSRAISRITGDRPWIGLRTEVVFPVRPAAPVEPLFTAGGPGAYECVFVQYLDARRVRLGFKHGRKWHCLSREAPTAPGRRHRLTIILDRVRRGAMVVLDDQRLLLLSGPLYPAKGHQLALGENAVGDPSSRRPGRPEGDPDIARRFSGEMGAALEIDPP